MLGHGCQMWQKYGHQLWTLGGQAKVCCSFLRWCQNCKIRLFNCRAPAYSWVPLWVGWVSRNICTKLRTKFSGQNMSFIYCEINWEIEELMDEDWNSHRGQSSIWNGKLETEDLGAYDGGWAWWRNKEFWWTHVSILDLLLFILYTPTSPKIALYYGSPIHIYADDTQLYIKLLTINIPWDPILVYCISMSLKLSTAEQNDRVWPLVFTVPWFENSATSETCFIKSSNVVCDLWVLLDGNLSYWVYHYSSLFHRWRIY